MTVLALLTPVLLGSFITLPSTEAPPQPHIQQVAQSVPIISESNGFRFELAGCEATQNNAEPLRCNFLVENLGNRAREISIMGDIAPQRTSYIVDSQAIKIPATSVLVAGTRQTFYAGTNAQPGVPFRTSLFLEALPEGDVSFIELYFNALGSREGRSSVTFRLN